MDASVILNHPLALSLLESAKWFAVCLALFIPLTWLFPNVIGQKPLHKSMRTDSMYWFAGPVVYRPIGMILSIALLTTFYPTSTINRLGTEGLPPIRDLPIWLQAIVMLLATDFLQYWAHRLFHHHPLWKYHSIHHSSVHLDWLSSARFHPVNIILYSTFINGIVYLAGFSPAAFGLLFLFNVIYSPLVHANLKWTYGPFRYVLASPVFHRWHHTPLSQGGDKNFAPTFPFIDLMFGTFYMPKGIYPQDFGTDEPVPEDFFGQLIYPFKRKAKATTSTVSTTDTSSEARV
jgi:sterol desaturase/sphingolipid hydroxylase (fatty acid hydroxylase superfamily)